MEEVEAGTIKRLSEKEAMAKFGGRLAVAALGAVPKELNSEKARLIHDGTYSVGVNQRIRVRDRLRSPLTEDAAPNLERSRRRLVRRIGGSVQLRQLSELRTDLAVRPWHCESFLEEASVLAIRLGMPGAAFELEEGGGRHCGPVDWIPAGRQGLSQRHLPEEGRLDQQVDR